MANLSLKTKPMSKRLPPDVGPASKNVDYYDRAVQSWLQAQLNVFTIKDFRVQQQELAERINVGKQWLNDNEYDHRANRLLQHLEASLDDVDISQTALLRTTWLLCGDVYVSWSHCNDDDQWRWTLEFNMNSIENPYELWDRLNLNTRPPGSWPPEDSEWWII